MVNNSDNGFRHVKTDQEVHFYWSAPQMNVVIGAGAGADQALPDVVLPAALIPNGWAIFRVECAFAYRKAVDTSGALNKLNGDQNIQVQKGAGGFNTCINLKDDMFSTPLNAESAGDTIYGAIDVAAFVTGADTYHFKIATAKADAASLTLYDVQTAIKVVLQRVQ